jgi:hypothetical protein
MKVPGRRLFAQCVLLAPAVMLLACGAAWLSGRVAELRSLAADFSASCSQGRQLSARVDSSYRRILAKHEVRAALVRGDITLRQTAARFAELDRGRSPFSREQPRQLYPGSTDEERYCRMIVTHFRELASTCPGLSAALPRLENELRELSRRERGPAAFLGIQGKD